MKGKRNKITVTSNYKSMTKEQKESLHKRLGEALAVLYQQVVYDKFKID